MERKRTHKSSAPVGDRPGPDSVPAPGSSTRSETDAAAETPVPENRAARRAVVAASTDMTPRERERLPRTRRAGRTRSAGRRTLDEAGSDDRIGAIIATIVRSILASTDDDRDLETRVLAQLASAGYETVDVQEAFRMLGKVMASIRADTTREREPSVIEVPPRVLTESESIRMSDEAISLFRTWQELSLMTYEETEGILQQVMMSGVGDVEAGDLVRIAENVAAQGSSLQLYLANSSGPLQ